MIISITSIRYKTTIKCIYIYKSYVFIVGLFPLIVSFGRTLDISIGLTVFAFRQHGNKSERI
jgi:hypothetical protein